MRSRVVWWFIVIYKHTWSFLVVLLVKYVLQCLQKCLLLYLYMKMSIDPEPSESRFVIWHFNKDKHKKEAVIFFASIYCQ